MVSSDSSQEIMKDQLNELQHLMDVVNHELQNVKQHMVLTQNNDRTNLKEEMSALQKIAQDGRVNQL
jgi:hypothetical protein